MSEVGYAMRVPVRFAQFNRFTPFRGTHGRRVTADSIELPIYHSSQVFSPYVEFPILPAII